MEVFTDSDNTLMGIMFQNGIMKTVFSAYPELLLVDATYKLNDLWMPVYLLMSIDGNGQGEIILVFLTQLETEAMLSKMVQAFKLHNPKWKETRVMIKILMKEVYSEKNFQMLFYTCACFILFDLFAER